MLQWGEDPESFRTLVQARDAVQNSNNSLGVNVLVQACGAVKDKDTY